MKNRIKIIGAALVATFLTLAVLLSTQRTARADILDTVRSHDNGSVIHTDNTGTNGVGVINGTNVVKQGTNYYAGYDGTLIVMSGANKTNSLTVKNGFIVSTNTVNP